jgi:predicted regulator of Ras-like GTPase activity (Roadblock/LC7/MglB family)
METVKDVRAPGPPAAATLAPPAISTIPTPTPAVLAAPVLAAPPATAASALDHLVTFVAGARGAVLASVDGFPLAKSSTMPAEPAHAAMLAATIGLARQLVAMGGGINLRQLVVDHDGGLLLVWPIGTQRVLAVLADARVDQRTLRSFVQANVRVLAARPPAGPVTPNDGAR